MSSSDSFGSSMLFQTINEDLNASLATADELSREFNSLLQECSPSTDSAPQQSSNFRPQRAASASSTYSGGGSSGGRLSGGGSSGGGQFGGTPEREVRGGESSRGSSSLPTTPAGSMTLDLSQRSLDSLISDSRVRAVSPVAQRQLTPPMARHERPDPAYSYGQRTPPNQSPRMRRHRSPTADRSPRGSVSYGEPGASYDHQPNRNTLSPFAGPKTQLDVLHMGRRSPNKDRSSSPLSFNQSSANTLPRNFMHRPDEGVQRHISPAQWNESDLDVSYEKKPHHTYEKADWIRPSVPNSNWRESNLDSPPRKRKDVPLSHQGNFPNATLPRNARIAVPPQHTSVPPQHTSPSHSPYSPQPIISRISIPPSSVKQRQRRPIPLTVLMQLQNPYYGVARTRYPRGPETDPEMGQYRQLLPQGQPDMRLHHYREVLSSGDVDAEVERLDPHRLSTIREWSGNQRQGSGTHLEVDPGPAPRPLSPTRLQPVVAGGAEVVPDLEELLRIRAEIPRALKRRGSVDQHQPVKRFPGLQPDQYKQIISKLLRRKRHDHKGEPGSEGSAGSSSSSEGEENPNILFTPASPIQQRPSSPKPMGLNSILRRSSREHRSSGRRARLSPLVLLLDGALVGELDTVQRATQEMSDPSQPNDEGITAMHNAICGGHYSVVDFLVRIGANTSAPDSHGWTPLHCAASCNDKPMCEFLVRNGAAVMAVTESDGATAAQKCDPYAPGFEECESFLRDVEEAMGVENSGVLYALWGYPAQAPDELSFKEGDMVTILQKPEAVDWWWASLCGREGFVPNNYFGLFPKVRPKSLC